LGTFSSKPPSAVWQPLSVDPIVIIESTADHLILGVSLPDMILDDAEMPDGNTYSVRARDAVGNLKMGMKSKAA
jgi:hypothetical protein